MATYTITGDAAGIFGDDKKTLPVLIDVSEDSDLTGPIDTQDYSLIGIEIPAAWDAANITFEGSLDNSTFNTIKDQYGITYTVTVGGADEYIKIPFSDSWVFPRFLKVATTNVQTADRTLTLVFARL